VTVSRVRCVLKRHNLTAKYKHSKTVRDRDYDFEELYLLQHFEVDLKEIYDQSTLTEEVLRHADQNSSVSMDSNRCEDK
jgi:hypothetical protein